MSNYDENFIIYKKDADFYKKICEKNENLENNNWFLFKLLDFCKKLLYNITNKKKERVNERKKGHDIAGFGRVVGRCGCGRWCAGIGIRVSRRPVRRRVRGRRVCRRFRRWLTFRGAG